MKKRSILWIVALLGGLVAFWLFGLKLIMKLMKGRGEPCPSSWSWIVNNPLRRWDVRHALDRAGLRSGETVLELGPGPGAFTVDAARRVGPEGRLIAVDIQPEMIAQVETRVREAGLNNVETYVAGAYDLPIDDSTVDRAFLITVLPEIPDPARGLREIYRVLKPGGVVSTTEEFLDPDYPRRKTTFAWARAAGFELAAYYGNWWNYTLNFRKPAAGDAATAGSRGRLSEMEFKAMNTEWRRLFQRTVEYPLFKRFGLNVAGQDVLEIGCGSGYGAVLLASQAPGSYLGVDLMPEQIALAQQRALSHASFVVQDASDLAQVADASKDVVVIFGVLHHIPTWRGVVRECARVLRPGGEIYLEEPDGAVIEFFELLGHWGHAREAAFSLSELEATLVAAGLRITHRLKFGFGVYRAQKKE